LNKTDIKVLDSLKNILNALAIHGVLLLPGDLLWFFEQLLCHRSADMLQKIMERRQKRLIPHQGREKPAAPKVSASLRDQAVRTLIYKNVGDIKKSFHKSKILGGG
jgi:hypothetical protein